MSFTLQRVHKYTYIYSSESHWDKTLKQDRNIKRRIGKIDPETNEIIFDNNFLTSLQDNDELIAKIKHRFPAINLNLDINTDQDFDIPKLSIQYYPGDSIKFGPIYFTYNLCKNIDLLEIIQNTFPDLWHKILSVCTYIIFENKPVAYIDNFYDDTLCFDNLILNSQRISDFLNSICQSSCNKFFKMWYNNISEKEYIALDTTSISSYSKNIDEIEFGLNKESKKLKQANVCLLYGENSRLPVYQTVYSGSMVDVSTLSSTIEEFEAIVGPSKLIVVLDRGFYSDKNLRIMLNKKNIKFLVAVPFTTKKAYLMVDSIDKNIEFLYSSNIVQTKKYSIKGIYRFLPWHKDIKLHTHIYYNPWDKQEDEDDLLNDLFNLKTAYLSGKIKKSDLADLNKYFYIDNKYSKGNKKHIIENIEIIKKELKYSGYTILISNHIKSSQKAHSIYCNKDVVEKAFESYKQNLGIKRFRVKSSHRMFSKIFIAFISLIIRSSIEKIMLDHNLYQKYTYEDILNQIKKLKCFFNNEKVVFIKEITAKQKDILDVFNIKIPNNDILADYINNVIKRK